jgi:hypothetical protein
VYKTSFDDAKILSVNDRYAIKDCFAIDRRMGGAIASADGFEGRRCPRSAPLRPIRGFQEGKISDHR